MAQVQKGFQDPAYLGRAILTSNITAGAATQSGQKFLAHAALLLMTLTGAVTALGTSTYTVNGTATVSGHQLNLIIITNTATAGQAAQLSTSTVGPFLLGGTFASGGTGTAALNVVTSFPLNTAAGTAGYGGLPVPQGAYMYLVSGTDATAASSISIDYQIAPGAPVTI